jgi:hypothetical protein
LIRMWMAIRILSGKGMELPEEDMGCVLVMVRCGGSFWSGMVLEGYPWWFTMATWVFRTTH